MSHNDTKSANHTTHLLDELISTRMVSTMTASSHFGTTVQNVLNTEVNIVALTETGNLNSVRQRAQSSMGPTGPTILRNMLVQTVRQIGFSIDISPIEVRRHACRAEVRMWQGRVMVVEHSVIANLNVKSRNPSQKMK